MLAARRLLALCIYLFNGSVLFASCNLYTSEVVLEQGTLKGERLGGYNGYFGVPYASVPRRFHEPGPAPTWNGTLYATDGSIKCNQMLPILKIPVGREDCLVANIYTPSDTEKENLLPVIVFIHGGGFYYGSNTNLLYDAKYLVQKGVLVVTINYRLGAFGFLCLNETEVTGNMGLKDQIAALRWIKQNIRNFGGDPDLVTLVGESAGATSVHYMTLSDMGRGLFKRAILESGSILIPISFEENPIVIAQSVVKKLGHNVTNSKNILKVLQEADANDIVIASNTDSKLSTLITFQPCLENPKTTKDPFLTRNPRNLLKVARPDSNVSVIIGINNKEGLMFAREYSSKDLENLEKYLSQILPRNLRFQNENEKLNLLKDIRNLYFAGKPIDNDALIKYFSDCFIIYPSIESTDHFIKQNVTVYNYLFKYGSLRNLNKLVSGHPLVSGANHADELFYLFDPILYKFLPNLPKDKMIIEVMTTSWTNFAKTGNPSTDNISWSKSGTENLNFLSVGNEVKEISMPYKERMRFWKEVYEKYAAY